MRTRIWLLLVSFGFYFSSFAQEPAGLKIRQAHFSLVSELEPGLLKNFNLSPTQPFQFFSGPPDETLDSLTTGIEVETRDTVRVPQMLQMHFVDTAGKTYRIQAKAVPRYVPILKGEPPRENSPVAPRPSASNFPEPPPSNSGSPFNRFPENTGGPFSGPKSQELPSALPLPLPTLSLLPEPGSQINLDTQTGRKAVTVIKIGERYFDGTNFVRNLTCEFEDAGVRGKLKTPQASRNRPSNPGLSGVKTETFPMLDPEVVGKKMGGYVYGFEIPKLKLRNLKLSSPNDSETISVFRIIAAQDVFRWRDDASLIRDYLLFLQSQEMTDTLSRVLNAEDRAVTYRTLKEALGHARFEKDRNRLNEELMEAVSALQGRIALGTDPNRLDQGSRATLAKLSRFNALFDTCRR